MTFKDLLKHYGTATQVARVLGVTQQCVANWKYRGKIPLLAQYRLSRLSGGCLRVTEPKEQTE